MTISLQYIYFATMQEHEHRGEAGGDGEADPGVLGDQHRPQVRHSRQQGQQRGGSHPYMSFILKHIHPYAYNLSMYLYLYISSRFHPYSFIQTYILLHLNRIDNKHNVHVCLPYKLLVLRHLRVKCAHCDE